MLHTPLPLSIPFVTSIRSLRRVYRFVCRFAFRSWVLLDRKPCPSMRATSLAHLATFLSRFNLFPFLLFAPSPLLVLLFSSTSPIQHQRRNFNLSLRFVGRSRGASHSRGILRPALSAQRPGCSRRRTPSAVWPLSLTFSLPPLRGQTRPLSVYRNAAEFTSRGRASQKLEVPTAQPPHSFANKTLQLRSGTSARCMWITR